MSTAITKFEAKELEALDKVASDCAISLRDAGNSISGALAVAEKMHQLRELITADMLRAVSALQGTALGFLTDKQYTAEEIRDPFIEATVRGFRAVGNEFNIIAKRFYGAKAGFERLVRTFPELSDFTAIYDVQENSGGMAKVQAIASWIRRGKTESFERRKGKIDGRDFDNRIPVRVNSGMGHDAVIGKAQRKFYAAIYDHLTGAVSATPEGDTDDVQIQASQQTARRQSVFDAPSEDNGHGPDAANEVQPEQVAEYRRQLAGIGDKSHIGGIARAAGQDKNLSKPSRAAIMQLCNEATKLWPQRIEPQASGFVEITTPPSEPPFSPPTQAEQAEARKSLAKEEGHKPEIIDPTALVAEYKAAAAACETMKAANTLVTKAMNDQRLVDAGADCAKYVGEILIGRQSVLKQAKKQQTMG